MIKHTIFTLLILTFALCVTAQTGNVAHIVKGKVINAATNQPVSYTNIGLEGTYYGTASDADGNFDLKIPTELVDKNIFFSAVGFKNRQFAVNTLFEKEFNVVKLRSQSYGIDDVSVAAQNMVLIRILRMASENIRYNFGAGPFNMHCSYSCEKAVNGKSERPQVAKVLVYDASGYAEPSKADAFKARKYAITKESNESDYTFSTGLMKIDELLEMDWVRSASGVLNPGLLADYQLSLESQPTIAGKEYWVIAFKQLTPNLPGSGDYYASAFDGKITINKADYSVLKIEAKVEAPKNSCQGRSLAVGKSAKRFQQDVKYSYSVEYKDLLLHRVNANKTYQLDGKKVSEQAALTVNRAHTNNLKKIEDRDYFAGE